MRGYSFLPLSGRDIISGVSARVAESDEVLPWPELRSVGAGEDVQVFARSEYEHRYVVGIKDLAHVRVSVRSRRRLGDGDLATGVDPGKELVVGGGVIE